MFFLIAVFKTIVLCVSFGVSVESYELVQKLPASDAALLELAYVVCDFLGLEMVAHERCRNNFLGSPGDNSLTPSDIVYSAANRVDGNSAGVTFKILDSESASQLVVLVPEEQTSELLDNQILNPGEDDGFIATKGENLSLWVRAFDQVGTPSMWLKGPKLSIKKLEHLNYVVEKEILYSSYEERPHEAVINVVFKWNSSDERDTNFYVVNTCQKWTTNQIFRKNIKKKDTRSVLIENLLLNDTCTLRVDGNYGITDYIYSTPNCDEIENCTLLEIPRIVTLEAVETYNGTWDVRIGWAKPKRMPLRYNVSVICTDGNNNSVLIDGEKTEVTISNVIGQGSYDVAIVASSAKHEVYQTATAIFPRVTLHTNTLAIVVAGAWCAAIICGIVFACWRKYHIKNKHLFQYDLDLKPEKYFTETQQELTIDDNWEIPPERLLLHEVIGEGAFGVVRRGMLSGKEVAVKMLKDFPSREEIRSFRAEMELMKSVGEHPHVVSLLGCCTKNKLLIVAEYCGRGDLLSYLRCFWDAMLSKRNAKYYNNNVEISDNYAKASLLPGRDDGKFVVNKLYDLQGVCDVELTPLDLLSFCRQIAKGMEFLAANRVVHRDLAARNVLVSGDRTLKIADFGLSRDVYQDNLYKQEGPGKMPIKWMALESLTKRIYSSKSDVWSFGVVVWEVVTVGGSPFSEVAAAALPKLLRAGYRLPRPNNCSLLLYELMLSCWRQRPRERPSFTELHARLDELLQGACAGRYISLEMVDDNVPYSPPTTATTRYLHMLLSKTKIAWARGEMYEKPHHGSNYNHYTSTPVTLTPPQLV